MIGKRVAQFEILRELGRGGMSRVYLAQDTKLKRKVALKFPGPEFIKDSSAHKRFLLEARAAAALDHPFICSIFEVGEATKPEDTYIAMEYLQGETLEVRLSRGPISPREALLFGQEIAEALSVAHQASLIHRDLKPGNIMITSTGHIKIMDFGLAKYEVLTSSENASTVSLITKSGTAPGTIPYMSPEQLRNDTLTTVSDLFPLGIILHEMLTGHHPFAGATAMETAAAVLHQEPPPLSAVLENCPSLLEHTVDHLLKKDASLRAQTALETESALRMLRDDPHSIARIRGVSKGTLKRPHHLFKTPVMRWGVPLGLLAALVLITWGQLQNLDQPDPGAETPITKTMIPRDLNSWATPLLDRYDRAGNLEKAQQLFKRALKLDPDNAPAEAGLAGVFLRQYKVSKESSLLNQAAAHGERAVVLNPHLTLARYSAGLVAMDQGHYATARRHINEGLIREPNNPDLHRALGVLHEKQARRDSADFAYARSLAQDPGNWQTYFLYGAFLFNNGRYAKAESIYATGLSKAEDNHLLYLNLAAAQQMLAKNDLAAANYQTSLEIRPSTAAYSNLGTLMFFQGHFNHAASAYESAVREGANDYVVWANLADSYRWIPSKAKESKESYATAIEKLNERLEESPHDPTLMTRKAEYLAKIGAREKTIEVLNEIGTLAELDLEAQYCVVLANELIGRRRESLDQLSQTIQDGFPISFIGQDPELVELRKDPAYRRLIETFQQD